jgi:heat shock protein HslJ
MKSNTNALCLAFLVVALFTALFLYASPSESAQVFPTDAELRVTSIAGTDALEGSDITATFASGGKLYGVASVNNYRSAWMALGNRIVILDCVSTMKMGLPPLMEQETKFLKLLPSVVKFESVDDGLTLITKDGEAIVLKP